MRSTILVVGGGIGGLATALTLHRRGLECRVFEQSPEIRELGVGINTLPHAIGELASLGLLEQLDAVALRTYELIYMNRFGQEVWRELRGVDAGHPVPQFSIHRGALQGVLRDAVIERLGLGGDLDEPPARELRAGRERRHRSFRRCFRRCRRDRRG